MARDNASSKRLVLACYIIAVALGVLVGLASLGQFDTQVLRSFLGAGVGASLVATGIAGLITHWTIAPQTAELVREVVKETIGPPARILPERRLINRRYNELTEGASAVDVMSLTLDAFLDNHNMDALVAAVTDGGKQFRLLVLSADSEPTAIRSAAEQVNLREKVRRSFARLGELCDKAKGRQCRGTLEVRVHNTIPYFAYFRADDTVIVGLYYSHLPGYQSEALLVQRDDGPIYRKLREHFEQVWNGTKVVKGAAESRLVCRIAASGIELGVLATGQGPKGRGGLAKAGTGV